MIQFAEFQKAQNSALNRAFPGTKDTIVNLKSDEKDFLSYLKENKQPEPQPSVREITGPGSSYSMPEPQTIPTASPHAEEPPSTMDRELSESSNRPEEFEVLENSNEIKKEVSEAKEVERPTDQESARIQEESETKDSEKVAIDSQKPENSKEEDGIEEEESGEEKRIHTAITRFFEKLKKDSAAEEGTLVSVKAEVATESKNGEKVELSVSSDSGKLLKVAFSEVLKSEEGEEVVESGSKTRVNLSQKLSPNTAPIENSEITSPEASSTKTLAQAEVLKETLSADEKKGKVEKGNFQFKELEVSEDKHDIKNTEKNNSTSNEQKAIGRDSFFEKMVPTDTKNQQTEKQKKSESNPSVKLVETSQEGRSEKSSSTQSDRSNQNFGQNLNESKSSRMEMKPEPKPLPSGEQAQKNFSELVKTARMQITENGKNSAEIIMQPRELGRLKLMVVQENDRVEGKIIVDNESARTFLQGEVGQLKEDLKTAGIELYSLNIEMNEDNKGFGFFEKESSEGQLSGGKDGSLSEESDSENSDDSQYTEKRLLDLKV